MEELVIVVLLVALTATCFATPYGKPTRVSRERSA